MPGLMNALWYDSVSWSCFTWLTLGFRFRSAGWQHVPTNGPALIVSNHQSFLDPPIVGVAARRPLWYLARRSLWKGPIGPLLTSLHGIPIENEGVGKEGMKVCLEQLKAGRPVIVFPEGTRTSDGQFQPLRPGVSLLIKKAQVPIIPAGIAGAYAAWPNKQRLPIPSPLCLPNSPRSIACVFGPPLEATTMAELSREEMLERLSHAIAQCIAEAERLRGHHCQSAQRHQIELAPGVP